MARIVVALGGNAILRKGQRGTPEEQWANVARAARLIVKAMEGHEAVITHGNGPQVGYLLEAMDAVADRYPMQTLDIAVAMTQGWLGYLIASAVGEEAVRLQSGRGVAALVTRVLVDPEDPAFQEPTKPVGAFYSKEEAERLAREKGWVFKEDPRGGYRRVVPSRRPLEGLEAPLIARRASEGYYVVAVGGGGIPVIRDGLGRLKPVEAVVDKDLASSLLARQIRADRLVILTDVPGAAVNYGKPEQRWLGRVTASEARKLLEAGEFPPGSMGPKVQAAVEFVEATCREAAIGSLHRALEVLRGESGTVVTCG